MNKEELEKEAEQYLKQKLEERKDKFVLELPEVYIEDVKETYIASAEPRERRIEELEKRCANYEMTISKMEKGTCDICKETEKDNRIVDLEEKISVLLSCKNCLENKGGFICVKEYENKCLAQKIQYIKELQEENAVLERRIERAKECMKKLLFIINSDLANYNCKGLVQDADNFIHNRTCNIRKSGNHCITEEPCIMCDN